MPNFKFYSTCKIVFKAMGSIVRTICKQLKSNIKNCKFVFTTLGRGTRGTRVHVGERRRFLLEICYVDFVEDWVLWLKSLLGIAFSFRSLGGLGSHMQFVSYLNLLL